MKKTLLFILFFTTATVMIAQDSLVQSLSFNAFMDMVKTQHPVALQAQIQVSKGRAEMMRSRGAFDPKAVADLMKKSFNESRYYRTFNGALKVPTWFGLELQSGFEQNSGPYLNPQSNTPTAGLWYAGISVPIGQGLFIDERRAALRQAELFMEITERERRLMLNELLYNAGQAYWKWFKAFNDLQVYREALKLAKERFTGIKQSAELGDKPYMDTLEAGIQVQNRLLSLQQAELNLKNARALLSTYLWIEGFVPLEVDESVSPMPVNEVRDEDVLKLVAMSMDTLIENHPKLEQFQFKIGQLKYEERWKREQLKPALNLKYNALTEPIGNDVLAQYNANNYTFGLSFTMPVFLRKERGDLKLTTIKINEASMELAAQRAQLRYRTRAVLNQWNTLNDQIKLYSRTVEDYRQLLYGETELFETGESSVFMVNSRELGYFNARLKLIELQTEIRKTGLEFQYAAGKLDEM